VGATAPELPVTGGVLLVAALASNEHVALLRRLAANFFESQCTPSLNVLTTKRLPAP
jgi:hypothetical protein